MCRRSLVLLVYLCSLLWCCHGSSSVAGAPCLPWATDNATTGKCECSVAQLKGVVQCEDTEGHQLSIRACTCLSFSEDLDAILTGNCLYTCFVPEGFGERSTNHLLSVSNLTTLNQALCSHRYNRQGFMCGECVEGHAPAVYSYTVDCVQCRDYRYNWLKYLAVAYLPLTLLYFIVLTFNISVTSGEMVAYVALCQIVTTPALVQFYYVNNAHNSVLFRWLLSLYTFWNLDILRSVYPPFCLHPDMSQLMIYSLDYIVGLYPLVLIFLTYLVVKIHDRSVVCVWLCRPVFKLLALIRRHRTDVHCSLVKGFASFFVLSYVKILDVSFHLLTPSGYTYNLTGEVIGVIKYLRSDSTVPYFGPAHLPYAVVAIFMFSTFNVLPLVFLCLYPCRCFQQCLNCTHLHHRAVHTFVDTLQGCYQHGPHDYRHFAALYLSLRVLALVLFIINDSLLFYSAASAMLMSAAIIVAIFKPYQNAHHSTCDVILLLAGSLAALCVASYVAAIFIDPLHYLQGKKGFTMHFIFLLFMVLPLYGLLLLLRFLVPSKATNYLKHKVQKLRRWRQGYSPMDEVPHRLYSDC